MTLKKTRDLRSQLGIRSDRQKRKGSVASKSCPHQYCPGDRCVEGEDLRACRHRSCPDFRCLRTPKEAFGLSLDGLGLSGRAITALERAGVQELAELLATNPSELILIKNLGFGSVLAIIRALKERGIRLRPCFRSDFKYSGLSSREIDILVRETTPPKEARE